MFTKKIKAATELERQLHYHDGELEGKDAEIGKTILAYTQAARWFERKRHWNHTVRCCVV